MPRTEKIFLAQSWIWKCTFALSLLCTAPNKCTHKISTSFFLGDKHHIHTTTYVQYLRTIERHWMECFTWFCTFNGMIKTVFFSVWNWIVDIDGNCVKSPHKIYQMTFFLCSIKRHIGAHCAPNTRTVCKCMLSISHFEQHRNVLIWKAFAASLRTN